MTHSTLMTDRLALARNRTRARAAGLGAAFLHEAAIDDVKERLELVNRTFTDVAIVTGFPEVWRRGFADALFVADDDVLDLQPQTQDLVIHAMSLHWSNDPVGQIVQCRRALRPDGLFLAILPGGLTLHELRTSLAEAEASVTGGLSPRILPMGEIRDLGALLQRAGLALPVADSFTLTVVYRDAFHLMADLRSMGEGNALANRIRYPTRRSVLLRAAETYAQSHGQDGKVPATFELVCLTGWAPHDSQQKPLRPGSARQSLADALGVNEIAVTRSQDD